MFDTISESYEIVAYCNRNENPDLQSFFRENISFDVWKEKNKQIW